MCTRLQTADILCQARIMAETMKALIYKLENKINN